MPPSCRLLLVVLHDTSHRTTLRHDTPFSALQRRALQVEMTLRNIRQVLQERVDVQLVPELKQEMQDVIDAR